MKYSYGIESYDGKKNQNDAVSIDMWAQEQKNNENSAVLYYKKQGEKSDILKDEDFCLIIMNRSQKLMLEKFGANIICVDSTHGLNNYDFELTTVMIIDEFGEGFPTAYMFTNRQDTYINEVFFNQIKEKVGCSIVPKTFMSDITAVFYNAWKSVMGSPLHQLYCAWHIDRAWQKNLSKIRDTEKRTCVYKTLKFLQNSASVVEFEKCLLNSVNIFIEDPDTYDFGNYFQNNYSGNYRLWAACYRQNCGINTNMHLESMHKTIKYYYLESKCVKRLDKGLHALLNYTRDKVINRLIKNTKGKYTAHERKIHNRHREANCINKDSFKMEAVSENSFQVHNNGRKYEVTKINSDDKVCCQLICRFCDVCVHAYKCTCPDYFLHSTICKHVHFVVMNKESSKYNGLLTNERGTQPNLSAIIEENNTPNDEKETEVQTHLETLASNKSENLNETKEKISRLIPSFLKRVYENNDSTTISEVYSSLKKSYQLLQIERSALPIVPLPLSQEPANKKIKKQTNFFSTKKKNNNKKSVIKPNQEEIKETRDLLNDQLLLISTKAENDHLYF